MTPKQTALYFREWGYVRGYCTRHRLPEPDRHALHRQALGYDRSSKVFTNAEFDQVLAVFRGVSMPGSVNSQVRQLNEPRTRDLGKVEELLKCIGLYVEDARAYALEIVRDTVNRGSVHAVTPIEDLPGWQLKKLIMDLSRRLNGRHGLRNLHGDTLHQMKSRAGVKCSCRDCAPRGPGAYVDGATGQVFAGVEEALSNEPF